MKKSETKMKYIDNGMIKAIRLAACCLLFFALAGNALAQSDDLYVIKKTNYNGAGGEHYLAHVKVGDSYELQDATVFSLNCLWYSGREINLVGTHHNYYFIDDANQYHFLSAPLSAGGSLSLSDSKPPVYLLNNTDMNYYFYDWDYDNKPEGAGVARGHQYNGVTQETCTHQWENNQCWEVYWVECDGSNWHLSTNLSYDITANSGRFRLVTVTSIPMEIVGTGGLNDLADFEIEYQSSQSLSASITAPFSYIPAYNKYEFNEVTDTIPSVPTITPHTYYYPHGNANTAIPEAISSGTDWTYSWSLSGTGAAYLSFSNDGTELVHTSTSATPMLYYPIENNNGDKTATLTLTVTYQDGSTQTTSATVTVRTPCQNPSFSASVNYAGVTISWTPTAESYTVSWKKTEATDWSSIDVSDVTSYTLTNLEYNTTYDYKVKANCASATDEPTPSTFTTKTEPAATIGGAVFGGGRMANVNGWTEVVIINTDTIGAVYGGNDIAGEVVDPAGSIIKLGVTADDSDAGTYNNSQASTKVRVGDVYGGGNGYYSYDGTTFVAADDEHTSFVVPDNGTVNAMTQSHTVGEVVWENTTGGDYTLVVPKITKTNITMANNAVKADSIFGGAKNAFITNTDADDGTSITVNGGTAFAVFGGNNYGGNQTAGKHLIAVNDTKTQTSGYPTGLGRNYGICYVFGGGNKVAGLTTDVTISGGMCDTVFAGGNAADVGDANVLIDCPRDKTFTNAVSSWDDDNISGINDGYAWNCTGIYNVRSLFGGNNRASMHGLPTITLTRGSVGTVYGGGNAGNMLAQIPDDDDPEQNPGTGPIASDFGSNHVGSDAQPIFYGTHVVMNSANMLVDYLYGGCQMSDVEFSTWVEIEDGHVGTVYGGCNISGDVGSEPRIEYPDYTTDEEYQLVKGSTYVKASGGTVYGNLFAGSNGFYHCNDGVEYISGLNFGDPPYDPEEYYVGLKIPTHNETRVMVSGTALVKENVYAGGNMAFVGFINATDQNYRFRDFVGYSSVRMDGGTVEGSVYGGGNRASIFGSNEVQVSGGSIGYIGDVPTEGALYGGNDRAGQVAQITNRVLPDSYSLASDDHTNLKQLGVKTYVGITGKPLISTVYGGGNGAYEYNSNEYCDVTDQPVQSNTFVDVNIDAEGGEDIGGYINTVYGGGNGVTVLDRITVFVNVENATEENAYDQVGTIFGGNNKGDLDILSDIILLNGQVNTVYGGCNKGAMYGDYTVSTGDSTYQHVGSLVRLREEYRPNGTGTAVTPLAQVSGYVYGGCRMNGVTNSSMVIVEGHSDDHINAEIFGGSDISGVVGGTSMVVVNGVDGTEGTYIGNVYGGGNGNYDYDGQNVYVAGSDHTEADLVATDTVTIVEPYCAVSRVDMLSGTANNLYAGGYAALSGTTMMNIVGGTVNGRAFGGGNLAGTTTESYTFAGNTYSGDGCSTVNVTGGLVNGGVYGGNNLNGTIVGAINVNILGGTFGSNTTPMTDGIFGGGYGNLTQTNGNVTVTVDKISDQAAPLIYGDVYGGSGYGDVNSPRTNGQDSDDITTVNIFDGTINGDIYGGGLGQNQIGDDPTTAYPAHVNGKAYVNVGTGGLDDHNCPIAVSGNATINGSVYGCNNVNGTPLDSVFVNIYRTAHRSDPATDYDDYYPTEPAGGWHLSTLATNALTQDYAISAVYGGGNKAAYLPPLADGEPRCATVHVWDCQENTIEDVYGGGNAADVGTTGTNGIAANTRIIIDGGRIHRMFGGGNGYSQTGNHDDPSQPFYNPGANIYGAASSYVYAGLIDEVYGGANQCGSIDDINLNVLSTDCCEDAVFGKVFGCANEAPINHSITTTVGCPVGEIGELYGGSNLAPIGVPGTTDATVTLNVYGGDYVSVFGGSKGSADTSADIYGNVVLNIYGGTIVKAFGGSDVLGNVFGTITVNVDTIQGPCPMVLDTVFGAGNITPYTPTPVDDQLIISPVVNIKNGTVRQAVFGGGKGATAITTANPQVNIGDTDTINARLAQVGHLEGNAIHGGDVYGGGFEGAVLGGPVVNVQKSNTMIYNEVFGGGDMANVDSTFVNVYDGTIVSGIYGGCNVQGAVTHDIAVNIYGGVLGNEETPMPEGIFGGGLGQLTTTGGNVTVTIGGEDSTPDVYSNVYGGSALGSVNGDTQNFTKVWLKSGTINGRVFGGGLGKKEGFNGATTNVEAHVNGNIQVIGDGTDVTSAIFGCNDQNGDPEGTVTVIVNDGIIGNVMGGGSVADYSAPTTTPDYPYVNITGGQVLTKVVGGGNEANVTGNPYILIEGGIIGTSTEEGAGVYGGCNTTGIVDGNTTVELTGGVVGESIDNTANIHGGGYGEPTRVTGNVLVNFGEVLFDNTGEEPVEIHTVTPQLYGELYGGSALGNVNSNANNATIVNILNGTICGNVFGGGLGRQAGEGIAPIEALVNGVVHVNVGASGYTGQADLVQCDVFGCNNQNGSPQDTVFVDVYQTYHIPTDSSSYVQPNAGYAIHQVFGGGNQSDYTVGKKNYVHIHGCENTIRRLFGGGNAAAVYGVNLTIDGGRFDQMFGGGNGESGVAANIGLGGITILLGGGRINALYNGSNEHGDVLGDIESNTFNSGCSDAVVIDHFMGSNQTEIIGDVTETIGCDSEMRYVNLYCGSNVAQIYGNINLTIAGGVFENVFGGSKGRLNDPELDDYASNIMDNPDTDEIEGHINLFISGGTVGNLFGACDVNGNVTGKITIIVQESDTCQLFIGNIYGGGRYTNYTPTNISNGVTEYSEHTPVIKILRATVGGHTNELPIIDEGDGDFEGNVYGGGCYGDVTSNPIVVIGDKDHPNDSPVTIEGNVYGGCKEGTVNGNTRIIIAPIPE